MDVCRLCVRWSNVSLEDVQMTFNSIKHLFGLEIGCPPGFPQYVCENCLVLLEHSITFYNQLIEAEQTLQKFHEAGVLESLLAIPKEFGESLGATDASSGDDSANNESAHNERKGLDASADEGVTDKRRDWIDFEVEPLGTPEERVFFINFEGNEGLDDDAGSQSERDVGNVKERLPSLLCELVDIEPAEQIDESETVIDNELVDIVERSKPVKSKRKTRHIGAFSAPKRKRLKPGKERPSCKCFICETLFSNAPQLKAHLPEHKDLLPYLCDQCSTSEYPIEARTLEAMNNHMETHTFEFVCTQCPLRFKRYASCCEHIAKDHSSEQLSHTCSLCGMHFEEQRKFSQHMNAHRNKYLQRYKCPTCAKVFQTSTLLKRHELIHLSETPFKCTHCGRGFNHEWNFKLHLARHSQQDSVHRCTRCSTEYANFLDWRRHMREHFPDDPRYWESLDILPESLRDGMEYPQGCAEPGCTYVAASLQLMTMHYRTHLKPFRCDKCPQKFASAPYLRKHVDLVHRGLRPHECTKCGKRFGYRHKLLEHMNMHDGVRNLKCRYCEKRFTHTSNLTVHERVHTGAKPYRCDLCGAQFRTTSAFSKHRGQQDRDTGVRVVSRRCVQQQLKQRKKQQLERTAENSEQEAANEERKE